MFFIYHDDRSRPAVPNGLRPVFSDDRVTFYEPCASPYVFYSGESEDLYYQVHGTLSLSARTALETGARLKRHIPNIHNAMRTCDSELLKQINGNFLCCIYDKQTQTVRTLTDRLGTVRSFAGTLHGITYHFPRLQHFRRLGFEFGYTKRQAALLLAFRYIASGEVPAKGVSRLPAGSVIEVRRGGHLSMRSYWNLAEEIEAIPAVDYLRPCAPKEVDDYARAYGEVWLKAVERRTQCFDKLTIPLSGGLDSRAVLAAVLRFRDPKEVGTCTFGLPGSLDFELAALVARKLGVAQRQIPLNVEYDFAKEWKANCIDSDGCIDNINNFYTSHWQVGAEHSQNFIVGFMGDHLNGSHLNAWMIAAECLGGPRDTFCQQKFLLETQLGYKVRSVQHALGMAPFEYRQMLGDIVEKTMACSKLPTLVANRCMWWDLAFRQRTFIGPAVEKLQGELVYDAPFTDNSVIEFVFSMPLHARLSGRVYHRMLQLTFPDAFALPTTNFNGRPLVETKSRRAFKSVSNTIDSLSNRIPYFNRTLVKLSGRLDLRQLPKIKFHMYASAIRSSKAFREDLRQMLKLAGETGFVDEQYLMSCLSQHCSGSADHTPVLLAAANLGVFSSSFLAPA